MAIGLLRAQGLSGGCRQPTRGRAGGSSPGLCLPTECSQLWFCLLRSLGLEQRSKKPPTPEFSFLDAALSSLFLPSQAAGGR